jgi:hypothetical protein
MINVEMGFIDGSLWTIVAVEWVCLPFLAAMLYARMTGSPMAWEAAVIASGFTLAGLSTVSS